MANKYLNDTGLSHLVTKIKEYGIKIGTCSTAAGTATKVVSVDSSFTLKKGALILVTFSATNTASNPKFNVNSSGAKSVYFESAAIASSNLNKAGYKNRPTLYCYNGTNWVFVSWAYDSDTTYTNMTQTEATTGTATTARSISAKVLNDTIDAKVSPAQTRADSAYSLAQDAQNYAERIEAGLDGNPFSRRSNCNMVIIGDSWSVGGSASSQGLRYSTLMCASLHVTEFNFGVGGAGINVTDNKFITQVNTATSSMTDQEKTDTGMVLICGGVNDLRHISDMTLTQLTNAMKDLLAAAHSAFPKALIIFAYGNTLVDYCPETWHHWISYIQRQAEMYSAQHGYFPILVIKNLGAVVNGVFANYQSDYLHLTDTGHAIFASHLANAIMGGSQKVFYYVEKPTFKSFVTETLPPHIFRDDDNVIISSCQLSFSSVLTSQTDLATFSACLAPKSNIYVPCYRGNQIVGNIAVTNSGKYIFVPDVNVSGTSVTNLYIPEIRWIFTGNATSPKT